MHPSLVSADSAQLDVEDILTYGDAHWSRLKMCVAAADEKIALGSRPTVLEEGVLPVEDLNLVFDKAT